LSPGSCSRALAPPTLDDALVTTLSEVGIVLLLFALGLE
jgi:Kef-type K+ transport system membrane component KefB